MADKERDNSYATRDPAHGSTGRDPEDRPVNKEREQERREKMMDKTLADSYPASDPPSSIPDPAEDDSAAYRCDNLLLDSGLHHVNDVVANRVEHQIAHRVELQLAHDVGAMSFRSLHA